MDGARKSFQKQLNISTGILLFASLIPKILLSTEGFVTLRVAIAYLCGLMYLCSGTYLFWRFYRNDCIWKEKLRAGLTLLTVVVLSWCCMLPFIVGEYFGPMNDARMAFLRILNIHTGFTILGGIYLGILALILLIMVVREA